MRTLFVLCLTTAACSTNVYPVPALQGGAKDAAVQEADGAVTLMPFYVPGDEDGGPTGEKLPDGAVVSTRDEDAGSAAADAGHTVLPDSGATQLDAGLPPKHTTCEPCVQDTDCAENHVCLYHDPSGARECMPTKPPTTSCKSLPGGDLLVGIDTTTCEPGDPMSGKGANMSCATWHAATGL